MAKPRLGVTRQPTGTRRFSRRKLLIGGAASARRWPCCTRPFPTRGPPGARRQPGDGRRDAERRPCRRTAARAAPRLTPPSPAARSTTAPTASTRPRSCATSTTARRGGWQAAGSCASGSSSRPTRRSRSRPGVKLRGLDLQRPRPRADPALPRGRAAADPLRQRLRAPAHDPLPRHPPGCDGRHAGDRRGQRRGPDRARQELHLRVRRRAVRAPPLPLPRHAARRPHLPRALRRLRHRPAGAAAPRPTSW